MQNNNFFNKDIKFKYREGTTDEQIVGGCVKIGNYFIPEYRQKENDTIIDVGAHIGTFSIYASKKAPRGTIYAIEACRETYEYLQDNITLNNINNVIPFHCALSDHSGKTKLFHNETDGNWGHTTSKNISNSTEEVPCLTLEEFMASNKIASCDFLRFNCEGAEFQVLISTKKEILEKIKLILILYHGDLSEKYRLNDLIQHLKTNDFKLSLRDKDSCRERGWFQLIYIFIKSFWSRNVLIS